MNDTIADCIDPIAYAAQYHPALSVARVFAIAHHIDKCATEARAKGVQDCDELCQRLEQAYGRAVQAATTIVSSQTCNAALLRQLSLLQSEKGHAVDTASFAARIKDMEDQGALVVDAREVELGAAQHSSESGGARERVIRAVIALADAYVNRGDIARAAKVLRRYENPDLGDELLVILYEALAFVSIYGMVTTLHQRTRATTTSPETAECLSKLHRYVDPYRGLPLAAIGSASRFSDATYVNIVVLECIHELSSGNFGAVATVLRKLNRYPPLTPQQINSIMPQAAVAYSQLSSSYLLNLADLVKQSKLTLLPDVVMIGVLSIFATGTRAETVAVLNLGFVKGWLEEDAALSDFVNNMLGCQYQAALVALDALLTSPRVVFDLYASAHAQRWREKITDVCVTQYASPYASVALASLAATIGEPSVYALEKRVSRLIESGALSCRIDVIGQRIVEHHPDSAHDTLSLVCATGDRVKHEMLCAARALSIMRNEVFLKAAVDGKRQAAASAGTMK